MNYNIEKQSEKAVFMQIHDSIAEAIMNGEFKANDALPDIISASKMFGVCLRTMDQAYKRLISSGLCYRRPKRGTFVCERRSDKMPVCGVWSSHLLAISQDIYPLHFRLYRGICSTAAALGMETALVTGSPSETIMRYEQSDKFDFRGIITLDTNKFDQTVELAKIFPDKKFCFLSHCMKGFKNMPPNMASFINDDFLGGKKLGSYFFNLGIKNVHILALSLGKENCTYLERIRGILKAAEEHGIRNTRTSILNSPKPDIHNQSATGFAAVKADMEQKTLPELYLCANDTLAIGVKKFLTKYGKKDIAVAGYDKLIARLSLENNFFSIQVPFEEMGRQGAKYLYGSENLTAQVNKLEPEFNTNSTGEIYA